MRKPRGRALLQFVMAPALAGAVWITAFGAGRVATSAFSQAGSQTGPGLLTGADIFAADHVALVGSARVGLITNQTGLTANGVRLVDLLASSTPPIVAALFSPEHGLEGAAEGRVDSTVEARTGLPVNSLYGATVRPTDDMLRDIQALVFDIQDSGARFYTYSTTMAYAMEAAARHGVDFYVLDRPNPISADAVQGPVMDDALRSFTGYFPLPTRHGMTLGELAMLFNREAHIGARLHVVKMRGYRRSDWYESTGLRWVAPSPNLRTVGEAALYTGVGMVEGANVSVGRGTVTPFEVVGAPWIEGARLASYLEARRIPGVAFSATRFVPSADRYAGQRCDGVTLTITERRSFDGPLLGVELLAALHQLYPHRFALGATLGMIGSRRVLSQIQAGDDPRAIARGWQPALDEFRRLRAQYLLY